MVLTHCPKIYYNIVRLIPIWKPWDSTPDESGVFFYAKNPDEILVGDAHFPDDKIKTFQELSHYRKKYWTFIKNEYMIKTTARSKKGQIERKDTS